MEEQGPARRAERQVAQLVENQQVNVRQAVVQPPCLAGCLLLFQHIDEIDHRIEAHPLALFADSGHAQGGRQMRLASTGAANQHHGVRCVGEVDAGQRVARKLQYHERVRMGRALHAGC